MSNYQSIHPLDLQFALRRCPKPLLEAMKEAPGKVIVGGGYLRSIVAGERVNDVDVFCGTPEFAEQLSKRLSRAARSGGQPTRRVHTTENAYTIPDYKPCIQIIHRWNFDSMANLIESFDFTCCGAAFTYHTEKTPWVSACHPDFYPAIAAKRLNYLFPFRDEEAGGSLLRVLKYYKKDYRIDVTSLAGVIARLILKGIVDPDKPWKEMLGSGDERALAHLIRARLREVDPVIDSGHIAHLPEAADV